MIFKDYKLIQSITQELGMNGGEGFSITYIKSVLSEKNPRKNEEIEIIASALNEATVELKRQLLIDFESYKKGRPHMVRVIAKRLNKAA